MSDKTELQTEVSATEGLSSTEGAMLERLVMPHSQHEAEHLRLTLNSIIECPLPLEVFDAFLAEYARTKNLDEARFFAMCEWDC